MAIVGVAVILAVGLIVMSEMQTATLDTEAASSHINSTLTLTTDVFTQISGCVSEENVVISLLFNSSYSPAKILNTDNYSISGNTINVTNKGDESTGTTFNVSYSCKIGNSAYNATGTNITKLATVPTWIGILITVALAFIVLGYFYRRE